MPKTRKGGSSSTPTSSKLEELGELFAATAALADEEEECSTQDEPYYAGGFGTRRGTVCHCSRCLRRSGPLTDDPGCVVTCSKDAGVFCKADEVLPKTKSSCNPANWNIM